MMVASAARFRCSRKVSSVGDDDDDIIIIITNRGRLPAVMMMMMMMMKLPILLCAEKLES